MMTVTFNPLLVALSIGIAICGAYTCFHLVAQLRNARGVMWKAMFSTAAIVIGGGIWSMHFIGMLALNIPIAINYDLLGTLISALVSVGMTAVALYVVNAGPLTEVRLGLAGLLMGGGISAMHYIGMAAIRANCLIRYNPGLVTASILIAIVASTLALWLAFRTKRRREKFAGAVVLGLAIPAMHYTGIAATSFIPSEVIFEVAILAISDQTLAIVIAVTTFLLFGFTFLVAIPEPHQGEAETPVVSIEDVAGSAAKSDVEVIADRIPIVRNKVTELLPVADIQCVKAESHYSTIFTSEDELFCSLSLAVLSERLDQEQFLRVHRSHIVNIRYIRSFQRQREQGEVTVGDGPAERTIPVSRGNISSLRAALGI